MNEQLEALKQARARWLATSQQLQDAAAEYTARGELVQYRSLPEWNAYRKAEGDFYDIAIGVADWLLEQDKTS